MQRDEPQTWTRRRVFEILEGQWESDRYGRSVNIFMVVLITANVISQVLVSVASIRAEWGEVIYQFNVFSVLVFTIEYGLRMWSCVEHSDVRFRGSVLGRLRFAATPMAVIDLLAIAPFFLAFFLPTSDLLFLRVFRLLRLLKLSRYFPAMTTIGNVVYTQRRALLSAFFVMVVMLIFSSSIMYLIEKDQQPGQFNSIPAAMWWGMATLTTVGYGDVIPVTALGKFFGALIAIFGIAMFALPAAIMASGFMRELERQSFLVSWQSVARLPQFEQLSADEIAEIAGLLRPRGAVPGEVLFRAGEHANEVFFLQVGQVEIQLDDQTFRVGDGEFFGEVALLNRRDRIGTATAISSCKMMVLECVDFDDLCNRIPTLHKHFVAVATDRVRHDKA